MVETNHAVNGVAICRETRKGLLESPNLNGPSIFDSMQSTAKSLDDYLDEVPAERKAALVELRELCRSLLKGFKESMEYGGPCYSRNGEVEVGFASQKNFIGLYILRLDVLDAYRDLLTAKA